MANVSNSRPLLQADRYMATTAFWEAARSGTLLLQYCRETARYQWFPRPASLYTGRQTWEWRAARGTGTLYSWTVTRSAWPGHEHRVPYVCAYVDLDEDVRVLANLVNVDLDAITIGMRVRIVWDRLSDTVSYPAFEPAGRLA